jgi:hypothetical protein
MKNIDGNILIFICIYALYTIESVFQTPHFLHHSSIFWSSQYTQNLIF